MSRSPSALLRTCRPLPLLPRAPRRSFAVQAPGAPSLQVFDQKVKWLQKERAAADAESSRKVDYLRDEVASRLCERLLDINRTFDHVLDLGANACNIARILTHPPAADPSSPVPSPPAPLSSRIARLTAADTSPTLLHRDAALPFNALLPGLTRDVLQSTEHLPYPPSAFSAVLSSLSLHWVNDLPALLRHIHRVLAPDSPFLAAMLGGDSLFELRTALQLAELDRRGGVATHTSPLADVRDVGGLLQAAGFGLLTVDVDDVVVDYPDMFALLADLQAMGEQNAAVAREEAPLRREVLLAAEAIYRELHGNEDGSVPATFRLIFLIGWKEGPGQQKPLARGSGQVNMADVLGGGGGDGQGRQ